MEPHPLIIIWAVGSALIAWVCMFDADVLYPQNPSEWRWFLFFLVVWPFAVACIPIYAVWYVFFSDWVKRKKGR